LICKATCCYCEKPRRKSDGKKLEGRTPDMELPLSFCSIDLIKISKLMAKGRFISASFEEEQCSCVPGTLRAGPS